jgi:probable HAF family extracellular repeat protein
MGPLILACFVGGLSPCSIVDLGALPGGAEAWAFGLNEAGQVAATVQYDEARRFYHAVRWDAGVLKDLGQLSTDGFHSFATAVNDLGRVVGGSPRALGFGAGRDRAFLYDGSAMLDLGALTSSSRSFAFDINDAGDVVGLSETGGTLFSQRVVHAVLWSGGAIVDLGTLGGSFGCARALNEAGLVVGASSTTDGPVRAFLWSGAMVDLGTLGGASSEAWDINEVGQIVGFAQDAQGVRRAFLHENGAMHDLGALPGARASEAYGINPGGEVVGTSWSPELGPRAVMWTGGQAIDLNCRISDSSAWNLQVARAINSAGEIVGYGRRNGETHAFLLRPRQRKE